MHWSLIFNKGKLVRDQLMFLTLHVVVTMSAWLVLKEVDDDNKLVVSVSSVFESFPLSNTIVWKSVMIIQSIVMYQNYTHICIKRTIPDVFSSMISEVVSIMTGSTTVDTLTFSISSAPLFSNVSKFVWKMEYIVSSYYQICYSNQR